MRMGNLGAAVRSALAVTLLIVGCSTPAATSPPAAPEVASTSPVFSDGLAADWGNWSWSTTVDLAATSPVHAGSRSLAFTITTGWGALSLANQKTPVDSARFSRLRFWIHGGATGGQRYRLALSGGGSAGKQLDIKPYIAGGSVAAGEWRLVDVPIADLGLAGTAIDRISLQDMAGAAQATAYLDDLEFYEVAGTPRPTAAPASATITVDASVPGRPISPLIYGTASSDRTMLGQMGVSVVRWGGNATTRHNWENNAWNTGSDWYFENEHRSDGSTAPGLSSREFVTGNRGIGAESFLTIPAIGWVAKDGTQVRSANPPATGGAPIAPGSEAIAGYDPASNRLLTSVRSVARKGAPFVFPPVTTDGTVYQDEWVAHLVSTYGGAGYGGVRYYAVDNEMDLWADHTHVDVHPVRVGYDEALSRFIEYADAIKSVDPGALVTGPASWGWTGYWFSALDRGSDNFATHADRTAHGNVPFLQWFLREAKARDTAAGRRRLDVLDIHYYPQGQGIFSDATDPNTQALRLRSTRSLWDPAYRDESWVANTEGGPYVRLIPRLREWIDANYPGTRLAITEWNWGAERHISGGLAVADVLGIFGREGVDLANYWSAPPANSPVYWAWRMYRNFDGSGSRFGDRSLPASASDADRVSVYGSKRSDSGDVTIMLINKSPDTIVAADIRVTGIATGCAIRGFRYSGAALTGIERLPDARVATGAIAVTLPPYSITLLVIDSPTAPDCLSVLLPCVLR